MEGSLSTKTVFSLCVFCALVLATTVESFAQQTKPWTEWNKKDAEKILSDSPWSQTQVETDTSEMFYSPTSDPRTSGGRTSTTGSRQAQGATNQAVNVKYHIRFFSARPVRQALVRLIELNQKNTDQKITERLHSFAEVQATDSVIITVTYESTDQRFQNKAMQAFNAAVTGVLKNNTYLELKTGQRLFLEEYVAPGKDGFGARFIFLRQPEGKLFITPDSGEVRFYSEVATDIKLNMRFHVSDMNYNGKIEY